MRVLLVVTGLLALVVAPAAARGDRGVNGLDVRAAFGDKGFYEAVASLTIQDGRPVNPDFAAWIKGPRAAEHFGYFVACAYGAGTTVVHPGFPGWRGHFGLAQEHFVAGRRGADGTLPPGRTLTPDERSWVGSCLLALANTQNSREYVSLRGNPTCKEGQSRFVVSPAEAWTMGYAEGVFVAQVLEPQQQDTIRGFTESCNLPSVPPPADMNWEPPSVVLGRELAFPDLKLACPAGLCRLYYRGAHEQFRPLYGLEGEVLDPAHPYNQMCPLGAAASCPTPPLRPIFVHMPRYGNVEQAIAGCPAQAPNPPFDPASPITATSAGKVALGADQCAECAGDAKCVGLHWAGPAAAEAAKAGAKPPRSGQKLVGLKKDQVVEVTLAGVPARAEDGPAIRGTKYTALIRYASAGVGQAGVQVVKDGAARTASVTWTKTQGPTSYTWLQVYPVEAGGTDDHPTLTIRISGVGTGKDAPQLDAVGFVPGRPWCCDEGASWCTEDVLHPKGGRCP